MLQFLVMKTRVKATAKRACKIVGGQRALADALDISAAQVNQWVTGRRAVPVKYCQAIVEISEGGVTVQELRPADWHLIWPAPGSTDPELPNGIDHEPNEGNPL